MTPVGFFDISFSDMVVVGIVALLLFGGRLPEVMRTVGTSYRKLRRGWEDISRQALDVTRQIPRQPYRPTPPASTSVAPARPNPSSGTPWTAATTASPSAPAAPAAPEASAAPVLVTTATRDAERTAATTPLVTSPSRLDDDLPLV
jgi:sec-independent protein translocase protein TatA